MKIMQQTSSQIFLGHELLFSRIKKNCNVTFKETQISISVEKKNKKI